MRPALLITAGALALVATASAEPATGKEKPQGEPAPMSAGEAIGASDVTTREDAAKLAESEFLIADANRDGVVDSGEFMALAKSEPSAGDAGAATMTTKSPTPEEAFAAISRGKLSFAKADLIAARTASFDNADADRNRALSEAERKKFADLVAVGRTQESF